MTQPLSDVVEQFCLYQHKQRGKQKEASTLTMESHQLLNLRAHAGRAGRPCQ